MTRSRRLVFPALISAGILWGTTVPLSKLALEWLPPAWLAFTRFALAAALLMLISRGRLRAAISPAILISGGLGFGSSVVLQNFGVERTSVAHAALLIGATPVLVAVLAAMFRQGVARPVAWAGFGLSLAGVAVIASGKGGGASMGGDGLVLLAQLGSAAFTVSQPRLLRGRDPLAVTAMQLLAAAVVTLPLALMSGGLPTGHVSHTALLATAGLVAVGTVGPTSLFAFGQSHVAADVAGAFLNLEPLVGAVVGTVIFADPLGPVQLAGGAAILAGIGLSSLQVIGAERRLRAAAALAGQVGVASPVGAAGPATAPRTGAGLAGDGLSPLHALRPTAPARSAVLPAGPAVRVVPARPGGAHGPAGGGTTLARLVRSRARAATGRRRAGRSLRFPIGPAEKSGPARLVRPRC
jgi:drug/metabolite transporter (DMT)-like permease